MFEDGLGETEEEEQVVCWLRGKVTAAVEVEDCNVRVTRSFGILQRVLEDPVACESGPLYQVIDILAIAIIARGGEDCSDVLAGRTHKEADAVGSEEIVGPVPVSDLLGIAP